MSLSRLYVETTISSYLVARLSEPDRGHREILP